MPETSIITGVYNIENCQSLHKSMQSILRQTYSDFEWILCDDGSTDRTWELLQEYASKDKRIRLLRKEVLLHAGGYRVAKETRRAEDYDLFMTIQTIGKGENLEEYLYCFCEDLHAQKRRKYWYRFDEVKVRYVGFRKLGLLPRGILYVVKPLLVGLIPRGLLEKIKDRYYDRRLENKNISL